MKPAHEVLGVPLGASDEAVHAAYRRYAAVHHPDHGGDTASFVAGQDAYRQLIRGAAAEGTAISDVVITFHRQHGAMRTLRRALTITTHRIARRPVPPPRVQ